MKKIAYFFLPLCVLLLSMSSCTKSEGIDDDIQWVNITLNAGMPEPESTEEPKANSRTELSEAGIPLWSVGDKIGVVSKYGKEPMVNNEFTNSEQKVAKRVTTFTGALPLRAKRIYTYFPYTQGEAISVGQKNQPGIALTLPDVQTPKKNSFDPLADILWVEPMTASGKVTQFDGTNLVFNRKTSVVKVVLIDKNGALKDEKLESLKLTAEVAQLAGKVNLNLADGTIEIDNAASKSVAANYTPDTQYVIDGVTASYLGVFPQTLGKGTTLTIEGKTTNKTFSRTITLPKDIIFNASKMKPLNISIFAENVQEPVAPGTSAAWAKFDSGAKDNVLLDFSYAGYKHGEEAIPDGVPTGWEVIDLGAKGLTNSTTVSSRQAFLDVLASLKANTGYVLVFPAGDFVLHDKTDNTKLKKSFMNGTETITYESHEIKIGRGNIILRGAGRGKTRLIMNAVNWPASAELYSSPDMLLFKNPTSMGKDGTPVTINKTLPKGGFTINVSSAAGFSVNQWVCLAMEEMAPQNVNGLLEYELGGQPLSDLQTNPNGGTISPVIAKKVQVFDYHQIVKISGNQITFKEPIMRDLREGETWTLRDYPHLENIGVEDLTFVGKAKKEFSHHASWRDDGAFKPITFTRVVNSWLRRVGFESVSECMTIASSANCSVYDVEVTGNRGHAGIRSAGSSRIFLGKIYEHSSGVANTYDGAQGLIQGTEFTDAGQYHASGVDKTAMGTVLWRNHWGKDATFESHSSQPRATLVDHCRGGWVERRFGGADTQLPNHLNDLTIWNFYHERFAGRQGQQTAFKWWSVDVKWKVVPPIVVGFDGVTPITFDTESIPQQMKYSESLNGHVQPESLYEAQLKKRLGQVPAWLEALKALP